MSTPTYVDLETISQADGAQSSRVPVSLLDDPYVVVRQAQLVDIGSEAKELQSLHLEYPFWDRTYGRAYSADLIPGHVSLNSGGNCFVPIFLPGTSKLILDTDSDGDELREEDTEEDESLDADDERQRSDEEDHGLGDEDHGLDDKSHGLEDERLGLDEEDVVPEGQQQVVLIVETVASEPLGLGYEALRRRELAVEEDQPTLGTWLDLKDGRVYTDIPSYAPPVALVQTPPSPEWSLSLLPVSPSSHVVSSPIASPVATSTATISVNEDPFIENVDKMELMLGRGWVSLCVVEVWYVIGVATLRALIHADDNTSGDARSWYMINGDAKSWVVIILRTNSCLVESSDKISGVVAKSHDKVSRVVAKSGGDVVTYKASSGDV
uniref:Uncharacterized protein n=1 Tax=Tanacetum cinerariifolium TaxID=118510 RepID=A0A6L2KUV7_TANCI|nr:hypothetical protein [Tanacetum cinerariifolium]